ncbi:hypothetical protein CFC21_096689 [Triticum aestivum]|uniref:Peptidase A1 domain-containing protein n=2 Tax=Triticum aestivum TaxID=4565 RepID=A0A3B6RFC8_WHEAT|nr:aspartic proteinase nepenthesin-1-like [Triticum aestivum]KAF7094377.1 hypothetical protein CFC21_096689 [Triticum aestivum]
MKILSVSQLSPCVLFLTILFAWPVAESATSPVAVRADLTHADSGRGFTRRELLSRMVARSKVRLASLHSPARPGAVTAPVARGTVGREDISSEYLIHFSIGTPRPQRVALELDTGSDLIWTQCACVHCFDQPFPVLNTSASRTLRDVLCSDPLCTRGGLPLSRCAVKDNFCSYAYYYGDGSFTVGKIVEDTFTFKTPHGKCGTVAAVPNLHFGCGMDNKGTFNSNESGIAGFGRGPMSLPSQLKVHRFSHCLTTMVEFRTSPVFLGTPDDLEAHATGPIQSTPFVPNTGGALSSFYYLSLKGVTIGKTRLPFNESAFALNDDGSGGTIMDSGTSITIFPRAVFRSLREAFVSQVPLPIANDSTDADSMPCFDVAPKKKVPTVPKLVLHLEGADWDLPRENYVLDLDDDGDGTGGGLCVVVHSAGESDWAIIGNFQQQNMYIVYDLDSNKMVFAPARCDKL